jgi:steroid 5-alpha reductase family enzyme
MNILYYLLIALGFNLILFLFAYKFKTDKLTDLSYALTFIILISLGLFIGDISKLKLILFFMILLWAFRLGIFLFIRIRKIKKDRRFDGIRENFFKFLGFWFIQGITVWIILLPSLMFLGSETKISILSWIGLGIWFIGLTIETFSDLQKYQFNKTNKKDKWISTGLWKYSRHPNYFGEILCWIGVYLFSFSSLTNLQRIFSLNSPIFIIILLVFITGLPKLEEYANKKWGKIKEYKEYKRKTSILIPWPQKSNIFLKI